MNETERRAVGALRELWPNSETTIHEAVRKLSRAGLLASPELIACGEACEQHATEWGKDYNSEWIATQAKASEMTRDAGRALAASKRPVERFRVNESCQGSFWVVSETSGDLTFDTARFFGASAETHAREWAARLNERAR